MSARGLIIVTGGSGFIGGALTGLLRQQGYRVITISRHAASGDLDSIACDLVSTQPDPEVFIRATAVIHLAGRSIFSRWTAPVKQEIYDSRIVSTHHLVKAFAQLKLNDRPKVFITASATGYYGDRGEKELTETMGPGSDFLAQLCRDWEAAAHRAEQLGIRTVQIRTAPVLGKGGLLQLLRPFYLCGLGGPIGDGRQWQPWIHLEDLIQIYSLAASDERFRGPINAAAPETVRYTYFAQTLAKLLHRPALLHLPTWLLRLGLNDFAVAVTASQRVLPTRLSELGFTWRHPKLGSALKVALASFRSS